MNNELPKNIQIDSKVMDELGINPTETDGDEISEILSDWLSNEFGFCHKGFEFEVEGNHINILNIIWDIEE